jgi:hypothetical protein
MTRSFTASTHHDSSPQWIDHFSDTCARQASLTYIGRREAASLARAGYRKHSVKINNWNWLHVNCNYENRKTTQNAGEMGVGAVKILRNNNLEKMDFQKLLWWIRQWHNFRSVSARYLWHIWFSGPFSQLHYLNNNISPGNPSSDYLKPFCTSHKICKLLCWIIFQIYYPCKILYIRFAYYCFNAR